MKLYIAAQFNTKMQRALDAALLKEHGVEITSRWMYETVPHNAIIQDLPEAYHQETALADLEDIDRADGILFFVPTDAELADTPLKIASRGGRHFELGYAYRAEKTIYVIGPKENVFHFLPANPEHWQAWRGRFMHFGSLNGFIAYLESSRLVIHKG